MTFMNLVDKEEKFILNINKETNEIVRDQRSNNSKYLCGGLWHIYIPCIVNVKDIKIIKTED